MRALVTLVMAPLLLLNLFGGIVSGIWLGILGEWWALGYGLIGLFSHFILGFILMLGAIFAVPAGMLLNKDHPVLAFPFFLLGIVYIYAIMIIWCLFIFYFFMNRADGDSFWPLLFWSFGIAFGPWTYMAQKDDQDTSTMTVVFSQIAYVIMSLVLVFGNPVPIDLAMVFLGVMSLALIVQVGITLALWRDHRRFGAL